MIDHVSIGVSNLTISAEFYDATLGALGMERQRELPIAIGYGYNRATFWIQEHEKSTFMPGIGLHVAIAASNPQSVDAFHAAALDNGGKNGGPPGLRPEYSDDYYSAFVFDPTGTKVEAVCRNDAPLVT